LRNAQVVFDISNLIRIQVEACKAHAQEAVKIALDLETTPHYTQNTHYLQTLQEKWLAHYKKVRVNSSRYKVHQCMDTPAIVPTIIQPRVSHPYSVTELTVESPEAKALRSLAEAGYPNVRVPDLARLLPPDSYEEELIVMADVRAFYHVAYKVSYAHQLHFNASDSPSSVS
jgi:vacuolar protein sorting-associated protein 1